MGGVNLGFRRRPASNRRRPQNDDVKLRSRVWVCQAIAAHQTDLKVSNRRAGPYFAIT